MSVEVGIETLSIPGKDPLHFVGAPARALASLKAELESFRKDAERYRWLRAQHWNDNTISAVSRPKEAMKLGYEAPSDKRLDALIDEAMQDRAQNA